MTGPIASAFAWVSVALMLLATGAGVAVLSARSLFAACVALAALCACAAAAVLALGAGDGALALALFGVAIAPLGLLGAALLSSRAVKPRARGWPWLSMTTALAAAVGMLWAAPTLGLDAPIAAPGGGAPIALAVLVFAAAAGCAALLGYGERGVFSAARKDRAS